MIRDIDKFLDSHLLEDYILGIASEEDNQLVEEMIASSPLVKETYNSLQENIELLSRKAAISPPKRLKRKVLNAVEKASHQSKIYYNWKYLSIAASFAFLVIASLALFSWFNYSDLKNEIAVNNLEVQELKNLYLESEQEKTRLLREINVILDPNTEVHKLNGKINNSAFESIAYWNKDQQSAKLKLINYPELAEKKCLQLWADVDGVMVSLGVIPFDVTSLIELPFKFNAESLNVTIEPEGGSDHPNVSQLIASVII